MFLLCLLSGGFFIINGCWILSKTFSASIEIIIRLLSFSLLMWCVTLINLQILTNPCIFGIKPTWSWYIIFLICCWIIFARILLRIFASIFITDRASSVAQRLKHLPAMWDTQVWSLGREDPLEKEMATHSSTLAWKIFWTEEPGRLQSMGSQRVGHNWATSLLVQGEFCDWLALASTDYRTR